MFIFKHMFYNHSRLGIVKVNFASALCLIVYFSCLVALLEMLLESAGISPLRHMWLTGVIAVYSTVWPYVLKAYRYMSVYVNVISPYYLIAKFLIL